jgi:hypothetical protein
MAMPNNKISDHSNQKKYWLQVPQLAWALSRTPQDYTLWSVVYMIAGEGGQCILSTPDLAVLAMMSVGKAADCRAYLLAVGLLEGETKKDPGYPQEVWHLRVPDFWEENIKWRKDWDGLKDRVELKRSFTKLLKDTGLYRSFKLEKFLEDERLHIVNVKSFHNVKGSQYERHHSYCENGPSQNERKKNQKKTLSEEPDLDSSFDSIFSEPADHSQDDLPQATDTHQRKINEALNGRAGPDPLEEIAKHLCWGIRGLGADLPQAKRSRNTWLNAARNLLDETNAAGEWTAVCEAIDEWFSAPPKADEWSRDNAKKPHDPIPALARFYSRQAAGKQPEATPGRINGSAGFAMEVFTGPVPEKKQLSETEQAWQGICEVLQTSMAPATFNQLIRPCRLEKPNGVYQIIAPGNSIEWLENRLKRQIVRAVECVVGAGAEVEFVKVTS